MSSLDHSKCVLTHEMAGDSKQPAADEDDSLDSTKQDFRSACPVEAALSNHDHLIHKYPYMNVLFHDEGRFSIHEALPKQPTRLKMSTMSLVLEIVVSRVSVRSIEYRHQNIRTS
jgi:hypothetical protein